MKHVVAALLAGTIGLAIAAASSAGTDQNQTSCAAITAKISADAAAVKKLTLEGASTTDYATQVHISQEILKLDKEMAALAASLKTCAGSAGSNAPAKYSSSEGLPIAKLGRPYPPTTFCPHLTKTGHQCVDAAGKLITFETKGDLLPLGMRFDSFTGTISGTPRIGQSTAPVYLQVCSHELGEPCTHWTDRITLHVGK